MTGQSEIDQLLTMPVVALLDEPMTASELATRVGGGGIELSAERAGDLLSQAAGLGLARVTEYEEGQARYVSTTLGKRSAAALLASDADVRLALADVERLRTDLLATVGHELRTPLTAIRTSAGLLLDPALEPSDDQRQQLLATIGRSADRMQVLLTELLDLARLRSGRAEMERARFDARELARDVAGAVTPMAAAREQQVRLELPEDDVPIVGDRRRLEQALLNLAANAQRFSPSAAEIVLRVSSGNGSVRWTVVDHGPGIPEDERARLFERFFVGASDGLGTGGGSGIGLPTALAIAQAHAGGIEVESEVGRGSTFHLVIPAGDRG
jgi:signal transduction histidine kinase